MTRMRIGTGTSIIFSAKHRAWIDANRSSCESFASMVRRCVDFAMDHWPVTHPEMTRRGIERERHERAESDKHG